MKPFLLTANVVGGRFHETVLDASGCSCCMLAGVGETCLKGMTQISSAA